MKTAVDGVGSVASERLQLICDDGGDGRRITVKTKVKMDDLSVYCKTNKLVIKIT